MHRFKFMMILMYCHIRDDILLLLAHLRSLRDEALGLIELENERSAYNLKNSKVHFVPSLIGCGLAIFRMKKIEIDLHHDTILYGLIFKTLGMYLFPIIAEAETTSNSWPHTTTTTIDSYLLMDINLRLHALYYPVNW